MQRWLPFLVLALVATPFVHAETGAILRITGIEEAVGGMAIAVFDNEDDFLKEAIHTSLTPIPEGATEMEIPLPPEVTGPVAISVFHDENDNEELDTRIFGMPAEPYGFSGDPKIRFGPPSFEDCLVDLAAVEGPLVIPLR